MATAMEVVFEEMKHLNLCKGSVVGVPGAKDVTGYLVFPMPPVGSFDTSTDKEILKVLMEESLARKGTASRVGPAKTVRKHGNKSVLRAESY